jgi:DNA polymerase-3 subunit delta
MEDLLKIASEYEYSVLAFTATADGLDFGTPKKPSRFVKTFGDRINLLRFDRSTENQLYSWLKKHFDAEGVSVSLDTLRALVFRSGRTMDVLKHEVEKLSALAHARGLSTITSEHVSEVCSSTPECDTFALSNAITDRSKPAAYTALEEMKNRRLDPMMAMGMIARTFDELAVVSAMLEEGRGAADIEKLLKINPYKLKIYVSASKRYGADRLASIVSTLARVDADSKFGGITGYTAVELFISQNL